MLKYSALVALALVLSSPELSATHVPGHNPGALRKLHHQIVSVNVNVNLPKEHHCNKKKQNHNAAPAWLQPLKEDKNEASIMDVTLADLGPDQPMQSQVQQPPQPSAAPDNAQQQNNNQQQPSQDNSQQQQQQQHKKKKKKKKGGFNIGGIVSGIQKGIGVVDQLKGIGSLFGGSVAEIDSAEAEFDEGEETDNTQAAPAKGNFLSHIFNFFSSGKASQLMDHVKNIFSIFDNHQSGSSAQVDDATTDYDSASMDLQAAINSPINSVQDLHALEILAKHLLFNVDSKLLQDPSDADEAETAYLKRDYGDYEWALLAQAQQSSDIQEIEAKIHEAWINGAQDQLTALKIALHDALSKIGVAKLQQDSSSSSSSAAIASVDAGAELDDASGLSKIFDFVGSGKLGQLFDHVKSIFSIFGNHGSNDQQQGIAEVDAAGDSDAPDAQTETPAPTQTQQPAKRKSIFSHIFDFINSGKASTLLDHVKNIFSIFDKHQSGSIAQVDEVGSDFDNASMDLHDNINSGIHSPEDLNALEILAKHFLFNVDHKLLENPSDSDEAETAYLRRDYSDYEWNLLTEAQQHEDVQEIEGKIHQAWINGQKDELTALKVALHDAIAKIAVAKLNTSN